MKSYRDFYLIYLNDIYSGILSKEGLDIINMFFDECTCKDLKLLCDFLRTLENIHKKEDLKEE